MTVKVGDEVPDVVVFEGTPEDKKKIREYFAGKTGVLFGVPGAFTPGCSKTHLPGYVSSYDKLKAAGAEVIVCVTVNDAFVTSAWADSAGAPGKVHVVADPHLELTKALGLVLEAAPMLGTNRSKRYSAIIKDNKFVKINVEADGSGLSCSLAETVLDQLKSV